MRHTSPRDKRKEGHQNCRSIKSAAERMVHKTVELECDILFIKYGVDRKPSDSCLTYVVERKKLRGGGKESSCGGGVKKLFSELYVRPGRRCPSTPSSSFAFPLH